MGAIDDAKKEIKRIMPKKTAPKIGIRVEIKKGTIHIAALSIIEDLFIDYEYFIEMASKTKDEIEKKRFLRAACLTLNAYIEGSINSLLEIHLLSIGTDEKTIDKKLRYDKFYKKCDYLEKTYLPKELALPKSVREDLRTLRNHLMHFKGENLIIWDALSKDNIQNQKAFFFEWLRGLHRHMKVTNLNTNDEIDMIRLLLGKFSVVTDNLLPNKDE
jgi:hypothetical protein